MSRVIRLMGAIALSSAAAFAQLPNPQLRFHTNQGDIDVTLTYDITPKTVINFLNYLNKGAYTNTIFHRSVSGFVVQAGGYQLQNGKIVDTPNDPPVVNEYNQSNLRGTIAMAKLGGDPNSATSQWFFNLADNSANLDKQNGGFTVFGKITNQSGLDVMDKIAKVKTYGTPQSDSTPLQNYIGTGTVPAPAADNYIVVTSIEQLVTISAPTIRSTSGVISASAFGGFNTAAPGSYIEIYGSNLATKTRSWAAEDFNGISAPRSLDGTSVTINGLPAFIAFISPTQINAQVPDGVPRGSSVPVVVTTNGLVSPASSINIAREAPGLLAPASFLVGGKQYLAAVHSANGTLVANSSIPGVKAAPAAPGETLLIYGIGWGTVFSTQSIAGEINSRKADLDGFVSFTIGGLNADVAYSGLTPGLVGVDQFNVVVPPLAPNGDLPVVAKLNGNAVAQTLFLPIQK